MKRIVVLGSGTGVGKTAVSGSLIRSLAPGALGLKPVESGVADGHPLDAEALARAGQQEVTLPRYAFEEPVSPHLAARHAGVEISLAETASWVKAQELASAAPWTVIETAGGAFSPLGPGLDNLGLAASLQPAKWVLVVADRLGALHDALSCLEAFRAVARLPDVLVLNRLEPGETTNQTELETLGCEVPVLVHRHSDLIAPALARQLGA